MKEKEMSERELEDEQFKQFKKDLLKSLNLLKNRKIVYFSHYFPNGLGGSACWETTILQYKKSSGFFEVIDHVYYSTDSTFNFSAEIKNKYWDYIETINPLEQGLKLYYYSIIRLDKLN